MFHYTKYYYKHSEFCNLIFWNWNKDRVVLPCPGYLLLPLRERAWNYVSTVLSINTILTGWMHAGFYEECWQDYSHPNISLRFRLLNYWVLFPDWHQTCELLFFGFCFIQIIAHVQLAVDFQSVFFSSRLSVYMLIKRPCQKYSWCDCMIRYRSFFILKFNQRTQTLVCIGNRKERCYLENLVNCTCDSSEVHLRNAH